MGANLKAHILTTGIIPDSNGSKDRGKTKYEAEVAELFHNCSLMIFRRERSEKNLVSKTTTSGNEKLLPMKNFSTTLGIVVNNIN